MSCPIVRLSCIDLYSLTNPGISLLASLKLVFKNAKQKKYIIESCSGSCADEDAEECEQVRANLEEIDTVFDEYGVVFVATHELGVAKENKVKRFPAFGMFKNEQFIKYEGEVGEETAVLTWALNPETLDLPGIIKS